MDLRFELANGIDWIRRDPSDGTILVTNGGVCEYLTRERLIEIFGNLRRHFAPCIVPLTETLAGDHDFECEPESFPCVHELAFSHNDPAIERVRVAERARRPPGRSSQAHEVLPNRRLTQMNADSSSNDSEVPQVESSRRSLRPENRILAFYLRQPTSIRGFKIQAERARSSLA